MARPTLFKHRKFRHLARLLRGHAIAAGTLELLWHQASESGDDYVGTVEDVEDVTDWRGKPGVCCAALVEAGFLDPRADGPGWVIHDFWHHCPAYVKRRRDREDARRKTGPQSRGVTRQRRVSDASVTSQSAATDAPVDTTPNSHLPTPISHHPTRTPEARARGTDASASPPLAADLWEVWRRVAAEHGADVRLGASASETRHLMTLLAAYTLEELEPAMTTWWASAFTGGRNLGLFVSQVAEVIAWRAEHPRQPFRAPAPSPARATIAAVAPSSVWTCPHDPHCGSRWRCEQQVKIAALKEA